MDERFVKLREFFLGLKRSGCDIERIFLLCGLDIQTYYSLDWSEDEFVNSMEKLKEINDGKLFFDFIKNLVAMYGKGCPSLKEIFEELDQSKYNNILTFGQQFTLNQARKGVKQASREQLEKMVVELIAQKMASDNLTAKLLRPTDFY